MQLRGKPYGLWLGNDRVRNVLRYKEDTITHRRCLSIDGRYRGYDFPKGDGS